MQMLCRNRVTDFETWRAVFASHSDAHREAGLHLRDVWQNVDDPDEVFFLFNVDSREKAVSFLNAPASAKAGEKAGVLDGGYHFVEPASGY